VIITAVLEEVISRYLLYRGKKIEITEQFAIVRITPSQLRTNIKKQKASLVWEAF
jgi:hypothetical protein